MNGTLYIVATPIGNLGDITLRAIEILKLADLIACEDTRVTRKLVNHFGINAKLISYNDHSNEATRNRIIKDLHDGKNIALVSDAGTPLISDPGFKLVRLAIAQEIKVITIPGVSSVMAGLSIAGLPTDTFYFSGFLPTSANQIKSVLQELANLNTTLVFFESALRLPESLKIIHAELGNRNCVLCRELTKLYEECIRGSISDVLEELSKRDKLRGELVLIISGREQEAHFSGKDIENMLIAEMAHATVKTAVDVVTKITDLPKKEIYKIALRLQQE